MSRFTRTFALLANPLRLTLMTNLSRQNQSVYLQIRTHSLGSCLREGCSYCDDLQVGAVRTPPCFHLVHLSGLQGRIASSQLFGRVFG